MLFSVRMKRPVRIGMDARGTSRWMPLDGRSSWCGRPVASSSTRSVPTPTAASVCRARSSNALPETPSRTCAPSTRPPSERRKPVTAARVAIAAPWAAAVRAT